MKEKSGEGIQTVKERPLLKLFSMEDIFDEIQELNDSIARRAFGFFEGRGRVHGHDQADWFRAESELLHAVHVTVGESDTKLALSAEVPGFSPKELEVSVEPHRVTITGKRETKEERRGEKTIYSESCSNQIFRVVELPDEIDPQKAAATLKDGVLELTLQKTAAAKKVRVEPKAA